jgi:hypothetical protein
MEQTEDSVDYPDFAPVATDVAGKIMELLFAGGNGIAMTMLNT